ncbi:MAG: hypothetical protein IKN18_01185 [Neisseriaceae bacterium]|nr:hypothetical protein [Neisseriaceae bacterium]
MDKPDLSTFFVSGSKVIHNCSRFFRLPEFIYPQSFRFIKLLFWYYFLSYPQ